MKNQNGKNLRKIIKLKKRTKTKRNLISLKDSIIGIEDSKKKRKNENPILKKKQSLITLYKGINKIFKKEKEIKLPCIKNNLLLFLIIIILSKSIEENINTLDSIVSLRVSCNGTQQIFGFTDDFTKPTEIYIDEENQTEIKNSYDLQPQNIVKLVWKIPITGCKYMFVGCENIVQINFTNFDTSRCTAMVGIFRGCKSITTLDLSEFDTSSVVNMNDMFRDCHSLVSLDVSKFDTSNVYMGMGHMFCNCYSLKSLNISNFNTSINLVMDNMFNGCINLTSIDLSNFDTSNVFKMSYMFYGCKSLISLNLSNFNTSNVTIIDNMFNGCESLKILDFSNCEITSKITQYNDMFLDCNNLEYIDFRNFKSDFELSDTFLKGTQKNLVINTNESKLISILDNCTSLSYGDDWSKYKMKINTENDDCVHDCISTNYKYEYEYKCYPSCLNSTYNNSYKCEKCHSDCLECEGPYTENNSNCKICRSTDKFLYLGNCISECKRNYYVDNNTQQKICKCELTECDICSSESLKQNLCLSCDTINGYYPIYDYYYNNNYPYLNCTLSKEGYYLDNSEGNNIYKPCYSSCKTCNISGNEISHNCLECKNNYNFEINVNYYKNCYDNCSYYHYYDESEKILYCTNNFSCPKDYDKLIEDKRECVYNCSNDTYYKYEFRKKCYKDNCPPNSSIRNDSNELDRFSFDKNYFCKPICNEEYPFEIINTQECVEKCDFKNIYDNTCIINFKSEEKLTFNYDSILKNIEIGFTSLDYNTSFLDQGNNKVFVFEQITITLTTSKNQKNDINNGNVTAIDLSECENKLREAYNISPNEDLYMKIIDVKQEGMKIPKIEYEVYSKLNGTNLIKLNLSYCENTKIDIFIPIKLNGNLDIFNSSSGYYNDLCYTANSDYGTDITLNDRKKEFQENNKTVCQEDCIFSQYNYKNQIAKCSCDVKEFSFSFSDMHIDKAKLYKNFIDIKNIANINILVCYHVLFSKKGIIQNYGSFILMPIILIHSIIILLFYVKNLFKPLNHIIHDLSFGIIQFELKQNKEKEINRFKKENNGNIRTKEQIKKELNSIKNNRGNNYSKNEFQNLDKKTQLKRKKSRK